MEEARRSRESKLRKVRSAPRARSARRRREPARRARRDCHRRTSRSSASSTRFPQTHPRPECLRSLRSQLICLQLASRSKKYLQGVLESHYKTPAVTTWIHGRREGLSNRRTYTSDSAPWPVHGMHS